MRRWSFGLLALIAIGLLVALVQARRPGEQQHASRSVPSATTTQKDFAHRWSLHRFSAGPRPIGEPRPMA